MQYPPRPPTTNSDSGDEQKQEEPQSEYMRIESWIFDRLLGLGFGAGEAAALISVHASWHDAQTLLAHGCPREVALEILL